jgi:NhaA family Na+:H+ antiporter
MATDIAFALGVVALAGRGVPGSLRTFLLTLAVVDDIVAIAVIALFYSGGLQLAPLVLAAALLAAMALLWRWGLRSIAPHALLAVAFWVLVQQSGVHATVAGVVLGLACPAGRDGRGMARLEHLIHPWAAFLVVPLFALANAGVDLGGGSIATALSSPVTIGVVVGLAAGKVLGISGAAWLAVRWGGARLAPDLGWGHVVAASAAAGVGFTVSLFVSGLAFGSTGRAAQAEVGVLVASVIAAAAGSLALRQAARRAPV